LEVIIVDSNIYNKKFSSLWAKFTKKEFNIFLVWTIASYEVVFQTCLWECTLISVVLYNCIPYFTDSVISSYYNSCLVENSLCQQWSCKTLVLLPGISWLTTIVEGRDSELTLIVLEFPAVDLSRRGGEKLTMRTW